MCCVQPLTANGVETFFLHFLCCSESKVTPGDVDAAMDRLMAVEHADSEHKVVEFIRWMPR